MQLPRRAAVPLRILMVMLFIGLIVAQTLIVPGSLWEDAPKEDDLRWPLLVILVLVLLCVQVVIVCTWRLLAMVEADEIFSQEALRWVDGIIRAIAAAWLLLFGTLVLLVFHMDDPGVGVLLTGLLLTAGVVGLLMVVMRELLQQATTLRTDMDAVI